MTTTPPAHVFDRTALPHQPHTVWALIIAVGGLRSVGFVWPFLSYRLAEATPSSVAAIMAAFGVGGLAGSVLWGHLIDRIGMRPTVLISMFLAAITMPALARATAVPAVLCTAFFAGAVYDALRPVVTAALAHMVPGPADRARLDGWRHYAVNAATAICGAAGGMLAHHHLTLMFDANGAGCAAVGLAACWILPPSAAHVAPHRPQAHRLVVRAAVQDARLWLAVLASWCALTCCAALYCGMPLMMAEAGLSAGAYGVTQVVSGIVVLAASPLLVPWMGRRALRGPLADLLAVAALVLGAGMALAGLVRTTPGYSAAAAVIILGEILLFAAATNVISTIAPPTGQGLYAGIWGCTMSAAVIVTPLVTSWALATVGPVLAGGVFLLIGIFGGCLCLPLAALMPAGTATPKPGAG